MSERCCNCHNCDICDTRVLRGVTIVAERHNWDSAVNCDRPVASGGLDAVAGAAVRAPPNDRCAGRQSAAEVVDG